MRFNKVVGVSLMAVVLFIVGTMTVNAQSRRTRCRSRIVYRHHNPFWYRHYDPFWNSYYPRFQVADPIAYQRERGYKEGKDEGKEDAEKGRAANATGHKDYLKSSSITFREAFVEGYNVGYEEKIEKLRDKGRD